MFFVKTIRPEATNLVGFLHDLKVGLIDDVRSVFEELLEDEDRPELLKLRRTFKNILRTIHKIEDMNEEEKDDLD